MEQHQINRLLTDLKRWRSDGEELPERDASFLLLDVLNPLFEDEGYKILAIHGPDELGIDFVAKKPVAISSGNFEVGIQYKHLNGPGNICTAQIRDFLGVVASVPYSRVLFIANKPFSTSVIEEAKRVSPVELQLFDPDTLERWVNRVIAQAFVLPLDVQEILRVTSRHFAELIARNPAALYELEWRDLERTVAEIFSGLGFRAELTPGSKDGGKDVILRCRVSGQGRIYYVEVKHWRSNKAVGANETTAFVEVVVNEQKDGGLFLSTSGFAENAFESITQVNRQRVKFGTSDKMFALAQTYTRVKSGMWAAPNSLPELLFEGTL